MSTVAIVVQQIMTEFRVAASEGAIILAITKMVLNLMTQNGYYSS
jgi:hypothetical protein